MKINLLIGIPCSGKSTFLSKLNDNVVKIDDPTDLESVYQILDNVKNDQEVWISDPNFCQKHILDQCIQLLESKYNAEIELNYLDCNPEIAINRAKQRENKPVLNYIWYLYHQLKMH